VACHDPGLVVVVGDDCIVDEVPQLGWETEYVKGLKGRRLC